MEYEEIAAVVLIGMKWMEYYRLPGSDRFLNDEELEKTGGLTKSKVIAYYRAHQKEKAVLKDSLFGE